ncbi:MAG: hypothetical protein LBQ28_03950 [Prevotellaceae bacterium]|jgi:hypothetical protein|nr:hypothetical protein [Prevotellaceae bacterium]
MKKYLLIVALIYLCINANAQAYQQLNIESNTSRYERELREAQLKAEIARLKYEQEHPNSSSSNNQSSNMKTGDSGGSIFTDFYSDSYITARLAEQGYGSGNCGSEAERKSKHLKIKNKTNRSIVVTGIIKVEFCQCCCDYQCWDTEKTFEITISAGSENKVNDYYKPNSKIGIYQTLRFWIDEIKYLY